MDDFSVSFNRCCANSTVEICCVSLWGMVVMIGICIQEDFNVFCGVCGVLTSVYDGLLRRLRPGVQFVQNLPSA